MFDFRKLEVYKKAKLFHSVSDQVIKKNQFSKTTKDQLSRASFSVVLNIAEGSGRFSKADRRNFFVIARSSIFECVAIFDILLDQKEIDEKQFDKFYSMAEEMSRMLFAMIKNLSA